MELGLLHERVHDLALQLGERRRPGLGNRLPLSLQARLGLIERGIELADGDVRRADEPIKLGTRTIPAGAFLVSNAQPTARMARNLLDPKTEQSADFIKKQEARRAMRLNDQIYDITAWNLPMVYDVETLTSPTAITVKSTPVPSQYEAAPLPRGARGNVDAGLGKIDSRGFPGRSIIAPTDSIEQPVDTRTIDDSTVPGPATSTRAPIVPSPKMLERATRECSTSPMIATVRGASVRTWRRSCDILATIL